MFSPGSTYGTTERAHSISDHGNTPCGELYNVPSISQRFDQDADSHVIRGLTADQCSDIWRNLSTVTGTYANLFRSSISEVVVADNFIFSITCSGICSLHSAATGKFLKFLNPQLSDRVRSCTVNPKTREVILVLLRECDAYQRLRCFSFSLDNMNLPVEILKDEKLIYPGFVEFDLLSQKIISLEGDTHIYSIKDWKTRARELEILDQEIADVKFTCGVALVIRMSNSRINVQVLAGSQSGTVTVPLSEDVYPQIIDIFETNLIIKEANCDIRIYDIATMQSTSIRGTASIPSNRILFAYKARKMLIMRENDIDVYTLSGVFIMSLHNENGFTDTIRPSVQQRYIVATSQSEFHQWIYIYSLETGELMFEKHIPSNEHNGYKITAVFLHDDSQILVTGDANGNVKRWH